MKTRILVSALLAVAAGAQAADFTDTAQVISATPIYESINEPREECWTETVYDQPRHRGERSVAGPLLGGVAGAIVGNQVGRGSGNTAATAVGGAAGAVAGDRISNPGSDRSYGGAILGGIAGAILGNQVGQGNGNKAATAVGAIAGAMVGDRLDNRAPVHAQPQQVRRCRIVDNYRQVVKGYTVVYRYNGRDVTTTLPYDPGRTVTVGVGIIDSGRNLSQGYGRY